MKRFWIRYVLWTVVGAAASLALLSLGFPLLLVAGLLAAVMFKTRQVTDRGVGQVTGVMVGIGIVLLVVLAFRPDWWVLAPGGLALVALGLVMPVGLTSRLSEAPSR